MSDKKQDANSVKLGMGDHVGAYRIERSLGSGGMAEVFYAVHEDLQRPAAIKVLRASLATDEVHLQRFMQEARAAASLVHPNIVQVYDVGRDGEHRYIAQEYIPGSNLREYLILAIPESDSEAAELPTAAGHENLPTTALAKSSEAGQPSTSAPQATAPTDRQLPITETLSILMQILAALTKSANSGIVHRDIKPENIMLTPDGDVKVADFGLARVLLGDDPQLTRAGTTLGTPMYMSPEQIQEGQVDIRSDLYSLGATLYHMLAGTPPYTGETPLALAMKHVQAEVPDLRRLRNDLPESMYQLVSRLLAKSPNERFAHPSEVLSFLKAQRTGDLVGVWPEHTVPLPGATSNESAGPLQATLLLQTKLRKLRANRGRRVFARLGLVVLLVAAFATGCVVTFKLNKPFDLDAAGATSVFKGIEKQESVQKQYELAMLRKDLDPIYKWEAVSHYFDPDGAEDPGESALNRIYTGMASLQWAAALQFRNEYGEAERVLRKTIEDPQMGMLHKVLAYLQIADGAAWQDFENNKQKIDECIDEAREIHNERDDALVKASVQLMREEVQRRWTGEDEDDLEQSATSSVPES